MLFVYFNPIVLWPLFMLNIRNVWLNVCIYLYSELKYKRNDKLFIIKWTHTLPIHTYFIFCLWYMLSSCVFSVNYYNVCGNFWIYSYCNKQLNCTFFFYSEGHRDETLQGCLQKSGHTRWTDVWHCLLPRSTRGWCSSWYCQCKPLIINIHNVRTVIWMEMWNLNDFEKSCARQEVSKKSIFLAIFIFNFT